MPGIHEAFQLWGSDPIAARRRFRELAAQGDPRAECAFGMMLSSGRGGGTDPSSAVQWFRRAADKGHPLACYSLAAIYAEGRGVPADPVKALHWYRRAAEVGDRDAFHAVGVLLAAGEGEPADAVAAAEWWRRAAARGHPEAMRRLGDAHAADDLPTAAAWYLEAAVAGDEGAVEVLARLLPRIREAAPTSGAAAWVAAAFADDSAERARLTEMAVAANHGRACYERAERVRRGEEPGGLPEQVALLERAAGAGSAEAAHDLATLHATGAAGERDLSAAIERYRQAATWGRPASLHGLGAALLEHGEQPEEGLEALRQAAVGGHVPAMMLYAAQLADADRIEALRWLLEADAAGREGALDAARRLVATMTPADVLQADRRTQTDGSSAEQLLA